MIFHGWKAHGVAEFRQSERFLVDLWVLVISSSRNLFSISQEGVCCCKLPKLVISFNVVLSQIDHDFIVCILLQSLISKTVVLFLFRLLRVLCVERIRNCKESWRVIDMPVLYDIFITCACDVLGFRIFKAVLKVETNVSLISNSKLHGALQKILICVLQAREPTPNGWYLYESLNFSPVCMQSSCEQVHCIFQGLI